MPMQQLNRDRYTVILKNEKTKFYQFTALLLVLLNLVVFIFLLIINVHFYEVAAALLLSGLYLIYLAYLTKKNNSRFFIDEFCFFILAGCWIVLQNYLMAFACIFLGAFYYFSLQKLQFVFTPDFVKKMNFPRKEYSWETFTNVLLKNSILTMDLKNNTLIQLETESNIDEIEFNEFARQQLIQNGVLSEK